MSYMILDQTLKNERKDNEVKIAWIPSHINISDNEKIGLL